ncbi:MAG: hypothetical protein SVM79_03905 [Chloroflexota bacterium]|nr:hypothetical protein [Chloroflexota bacterium]
MRRLNLSDEEINAIVRLKKTGANWTKVQAETGINRRTAKRAYEKWEQSASVRELKEARKEVAAQLFREHMDALIRLSASLVTHLRAPARLADMEKNAKEFYDWLYQQNLLQRGAYSSHKPVQVGIGLGDLQSSYVEDTQSFYAGDMQSNILENRLLFKSLKAHTNEEVRWAILQEWEQARDKCARIAPRLRKEATEVITNFIKQEREPNFLQRIKEDSEQSNPAGEMSELALRHAWDRILQDRLDEEGPWFETVSRSDGRTHIVYVKPKAEIVMGFGEKSLADKVTRICNSAADNLRRGESARSLKDEVLIITKAANELREALNSVRLIPMILRTRCELCPA